MLLTSFSRRGLLSRIGVAGVAGLSTAGLGSLGFNGNEGPFKRTLDFSKPEDNLTGIIKLIGSLEEGDVPHWYVGTIYGVTEGKAPLPLFDLEGSEISYFIPQDDGSYHAHSKTISYFRDHKTREILETFENPYTGEVNQVQPNLIAADGRYYDYSVNGIRMNVVKDMVPDEPLLLKWTDLGDHTLLQTQRQYPPGITFGESQNSHCPTRELHDPDLPKVINTFGSPTYFAPWPGWLNMKGHPGRVVWTVNTRKMNSIKDYPKEFLGLLEKNHPDRLSAKPS